MFLRYLELFRYWKLQLNNPMSNIYSEGENVFLLNHYLTFRNLFMSCGIFFISIIKWRKTPIVYQWNINNLKYSFLISNKVGENIGANLKLKTHLIIKLVSINYKQLSQLFLYNYSSNLSTAKAQIPLIY